MKHSLLSIIFTLNSLERKYKRRLFRRRKKKEKESSSSTSDEENFRYFNKRTKRSSTRLLRIFASKQEVASNQGSTLNSIY